jgi:hypothetical protein
MSAYSNSIKEIVERYRVDTGTTGPVDPHAIAEYAYARGLMKPNPTAVIDVMASSIAQVFREEYRVDRHGRRYRAMHATTEKRGSKTMALWADLDDPTAPHTHFQKSFAQRRNQIVGDCVQLKTDVDVYNDKRQPVEPIQIPLDFTYDVAELQLRPRKVA